MENLEKREYLQKAIEVLVAMGHTETAFELRVIYDSLRNWSGTVDLKASRDAIKRHTF